MADENKAAATEAAEAQTIESNFQHRIDHCLELEK